MYHSNIELRRAAPPISSAYSNDDMIETPDRMYISHASDQNAIWWTRDKTVYQGHGDW